jgi:hypothetical protein
VASDAYSKTVTIKAPPGGSGYDSSWNADFKKAFGASADITLQFEQL